MTAVVTGVADQNPDHELYYAISAVAIVQRLVHLNVHNQMSVIEKNLKIAAIHQRKPVIKTISLLSLAHLRKKQPEKNSKNGLKLY